MGNILISLIVSFTISSRPGLKDGAAREMIAQAAVCNPSVFGPGLLEDVMVMAQPQYMMEQLDKYFRAWVRLALNT